MRKYLLLVPRGYPSFQGTRYVGSPRQKGYPKKWLFFVEARWEEQVVAQKGGGVFVLRKFLRKNLVSQGSPGIVSAAPGQSPMFPHPHKPAGSP